MTAAMLPAHLVQPVWLDDAPPPLDYGPDFDDGLLDMGVSITVHPPTTSTTGSAISEHGAPDVVGAGMTAASERSDAADFSEIMRALRVLSEPGQVVELRAPDVSNEPGGWKAPHTVSGYFTVRAKLANAAVELSRYAKGVYITVNPINPALLARAAERTRAMGNGDPLTSDKDITARRWLLIDVDAGQPAGISSSDAEHAAAIKLAQSIREYLALAGWPAGVLADSGNGAHLLYRVDLPADDGGLTARVLAALAARFDTPTAHIDKKVFNPARIWKLYGTIARKGDSTADRPHRIARLLEAPDDLHAVTHDLLEAVGGQAPPAKPAARQQQPAAKSAFDLDRWISDHGLDVSEPKPYDGGRKWIFNTCPWDADHKNKSAWIIQIGNGAISAGCHHNGCNGKTWADLRELHEPGYKAKQDAWDFLRQSSAAAPGKMPNGKRLEIVCNGRQLREVAADGLAALAAANNPPALFVRSGALVRVKIDEKGRPTIESASENILRERLGNSADWYTLRVFNDIPTKTACPPPLDVVRQIMAAGAWPFPGIDSIIECPALRPDGTVITAPGYDAATGLYYHPTPGLKVGDIPDRPTPGQVQAALSLIREAIGDFPYEDEASEANALAAYLTPLLRPAINGRIPLGLIDAPNPGTGKSLLAETIGQTATGRVPAMMTAPKDADEWRKRITATLIEGSPIVIIDNLSGMLFAGELNAVLTAHVWKDRILGASQNVSLPSNAIWFATGNNIRLGGDIPRRCYWIRMDAKLSRPWQRTGFQHADLQGWITANRGRLIAAGLTLARAWWAAGCPDAHAPHIGGFSDWTRTLGGVLAAAGVPAFLANLTTMYETADDDGPQWETFLLALHEKHGRESVTVAAICKDLADDEALRDLVPDSLGDLLSADGKIKPTFRRALGKAFQYRQGTRYGDAQARIERLGKDAHAKTVTWRLKCCRAECKLCGYAGIAGIVSPNAHSRSDSPISGTAAAEPLPALPALPANNTAADLLTGEI